MVQRVKKVVNPKTGKWIVVNGPTWNTLTDAQKRKARAGPSRMAPKPGQGPRKPLPKKVPRKTAQQKKKAYSQTRRMKVVKKTQPLSKTRSTLPASRQYKRKALTKQIQRKGDGRGSRTRGWAGAGPQKGRERHELRKKCGDRCFLNPPEGYPVCAALRTGQGCRIDCRGVTAAKVRSAQWKNRTVYRKASSLQKKKCQAPARRPRGRPRKLA